MRREIARRKTRRIIGGWNTIRKGWRRKKRLRLRRTGSRKSLIDHRAGISMWRRIDIIDELLIHSMYYFMYPECPYSSSSSASSLTTLKKRSSYTPLDVET